MNIKRNNAARMNEIAEELGRIRNQQAELTSRQLKLGKELCDLEGATPDATEEETEAFDQVMAGEAWQRNILYVPIDPTESRKTKQPRSRTKRAARDMYLIGLNVMATANAYWFEDTTGRWKEMYRQGQLLVRSAGYEIQEGERCVIDDDQMMESCAKFDGLRITGAARDELAENIIQIQIPQRLTAPVAAELIAELEDSAEELEIDGRMLWKAQNRVYLEYVYGSQQEDRSDLSENLRIAALRRAGITRSAKERHFFIVRKS